MLKTNKINLRVDDQLLALIRLSEGKNDADKSRNLIMQALGVTPTYQQNKGKS